MAGSYPNVPGRRMPWDADGTVSVSRRLSGGTADQTKLTELSAADAAELNDEDEVGVSPPVNPGTGVAMRLAWIFPELREIDGIFLRTTEDPGNISLVEDSGDTTNGMDGSWSTVVADYDDPNSDVYANGEYRNAITSTARSNKRGLRLQWNRQATNTWRAFHFYGEIAPGETPDRLLWVDNDTGSEFGLPIDYGDIPRGSAEDREVLLRNNSGSLTAASVQITAEAIFLDSGSWYTFKEAGGSFQATLPLSSSIGAGSDSPVLTIRRITPDDETLGLHAGRALASVGSWS